MKTRLFVFLSTLIAVLICFTGFAIAEEGITDTEIHIGSFGPQTGPAAPWGAVPRGSEAYFKMINDEGGIHGRKVVYHYFDDGYNPAKTKAGVKQLQESDHSVFAWVAGVGSAPGMAIKDYLMDRKIPWIAPSAGSFAWLDPPQKYLFAVYPLYIIEAKALVKYAVETMKKGRIGIIYQNDEYGKNGLAGAKAQLAKYGMKLAVAIPQNVTDTDLKPHVAKLMKSKADTVLLWVGPGAVARTLGTAHAMKFKPQWMATSTLSDFPFLYKITRGLFAGVITAYFGEPIDSVSPLMNRYKNAFNKYAKKGERWGTFFLAGFGYAEPLVEAMKRAGRNLTREKVVFELEHMKNFQGSQGKISFKPFDRNDIYSRQGQTSVVIMQCLKGAKAKLLTDWIAPQFDPSELAH